MTTNSGNPTEANPRERIWFFPDKFWRATKNMPPDEVANLMAEVEGYAAAGDVQARLPVEHHPCDPSLHG